MSKIFKTLSEFFDFVENPRMMLPCPVHPHHGSIAVASGRVGIHYELLAM